MKSKPAKKSACHEADAESGAESTELRCQPCDLPEFCRNNYYTGKLLTERNLRAEQRYLIDKLRLHHLALHGWGVVCGLKVKPHPYCAELRVVIEPGQAIDGCGREILVREEAQVELPQPDPTTKEPEEPCPPEPEEDDKPYAEKSYPDKPEKPYPDKPDKPYPSDPYQRGPAHEHPHHGETPEEDEDDDEDEEKPAAGYRRPTRPQTEGEGYPQSPRRYPKRHDLYVCLRYAECAKEFSPAPFDECACNGSAKKPNWICETYKVEITDEEPEDWQKIRDAWSECHVGDCMDLYESMLEPCHKPGWPECIPLAVIRDYAWGEKVTEDMIDNSVRPLLPSTRLLDQLIRCILHKLPTRQLTRIVDTNWTHDGEYKCREFWDRFIGDDKSPDAFRVTFSDPVRTEGLTPRSFQAIVVRQPRKGNAGGVLEVAPAQVWASSDRLNFYLRIDPEYARRLREDYRFEVYLTLRCHVIVDDRGQAVDGDLLATLKNNDYDADVPPATGDGIPGGTFESWIRVLG